MYGVRRIDIEAALIPSSTSDMNSALVADALAAGDAYERVSLSGTFSSRKGRSLLFLSIVFLVCAASDLMPIVKAKPAYLPSVTQKVFFADSFPSLDPLPKRLAPVDGVRGLLFDVGDGFRRPVSWCRLI